MQILYKDLINEIEKQQKGTKQNGRHANTTYKTLYVYIPGPVPVTMYTCTCTRVQVYTCMQLSLIQETLAY